MGGMMEFNKKRGKRSPLKELPLRQAGQSLSAEMDRIILDKLQSPMLFALILALLAVFEWWRSFREIPPQPVLMTLTALAASGFALYRFISVRKRIRALRLGMDGEKTVAQFLEMNRDSDWYILNDIPSESFNVDHVVVTPKGLFVVETKTLSKPASGEVKATFDGEHLRVNGREFDRNPVIQVRAARDWVKELLKRETGKTYPVKGAVVMPGWYVEGPKDWTSTDVWVLNHKALPAFIRKEQCVVANEDVHLAIARIADYVQRSDKSERS
jgi:hypothetical protein